MRPDLTCLDIVDSRGTHAKSVANFTVSERSRRYQVTNDRDLRLGEFCKSVPRSAPRPIAEPCACVSHILNWGDVFKIRQTVIRLAAVFVVDLLSFWARTEECFSDEPMNADGAMVDTDAQVAATHAGFQDHPRFGARSGRFTPDPSKAGHGVVAQSSPFFGFQFFGSKMLFGHWGHLLERLSSWLERLRGCQSFGPFAHCTISRHGAIR